MANQPTKYSKFLVGAASAALVASAVAPVASAAEFTDSKAFGDHASAIEALVDLGVVKGYPDGSFKPNQELTRNNVVKFLGKWLVAQGYEIPADAVSNPRFVDLKSTSEKETLEYAAVVKDNGVFVGSNGNLMGANKMTREDMAVVIVRALNTVNGFDLDTYVAEQDFKRDVKDLNTAYASKKSAIDVFDFFDITNPAVANFNPKNTTTRAQFASFLNRAITTDFSAVTGVAIEGVESIKAVNATTVEVTYKDAVKDVKTSDYSIEGLAISNAAVKQTDNKVVVLTTAAQTGDKVYTVKSGGNTVGTFKGISAVVPTKITMNTASTQGVVGKEVTLKADIGVKEAGVPVTFNVAAGSKLNKDHVEEVTTDANGIATYSYTQYVSGESDDVVAYPTGAPAVRSLATVYWGVDTILSVTELDEKQGNSVANGANKVYKVTSKDPKTGKAVANQKLHVTFVENVGVTIDKTSKATVNGTNPMQLSNGTAAVTAEVVTDSKGEATFTVSGHNTTVTPVVFPNQVVNKTDVNEWEATKLQAQVAEKLVFGAVQADYVIDVTRDGGEEAAVGVKNGREYKVLVKTKDGKVAANEIINLAFNEDLDRNINTNTAAYFVDGDGVAVPNPRTQAYTVKTDAKGEATFTIASDNPAGIKDYATPIAWIDINTSNAKEGKFDDGEPFKISQISYFAEAKLTDGTVKAYNAADKAVKEFTGLETATFKFTAANQSGKAMDLPTGYSHIEASFTVFNDGAHDITVDGHVVSPNRSYTTSTKGSATAPAQIEVKSVDNQTTSVRVVANGTAIPYATTNNRAINLGSHSAEAKFTSTTSIGVIHTGFVESIDTTDKKIKFVGKDSMSYKDASFKNVNAVTLTQAEFEALIKANEGTAKVTVKKDGDKVIFEIVSLGDLASSVSAINAATTLAEVKAALASVKEYQALTADTKDQVAADILDALNLGTIFTPASLKAAVDIELRVTAKHSAGTVTVPGNKAKGSFVVGTDKLEIETATGATSYNGVTVKFVKNTVVGTVVTTDYDSVDKVLTVKLPVSAVDSVTGETTLDAAEATYTAIETAIEAFNSSALTVTLTGFTGEASALVGKTIELKGATPTVEGVDQKLVLTFSHALTTETFADLTFAGGSTVTSAESSATVSADKKTVTITVSGTDNVVVGDTITAYGNYAVTGKSIVQSAVIK